MAVADAENRRLVGHIDDFAHRRVDVACYGLLGGSGAAKDLDQPGFHVRLELLAMHSIVHTFVLLAYVAEPGVAPAAKSP
ncbi:MAG: hypothetical protein N2C14_18330, partial [Planctomycetales bacterium]